MTSIDTTAVTLRQRVRFTAAGVDLHGDLAIPETPRAMIVFVHGSGSGAESLRNRCVETMMNDAGLATFVFDLLTPAEQADRSNMFAIDAMAARLSDVTRWLGSRPDTAALPIGYFGAGTGAAAALVAAADPRTSVAAVVSRGGRPDLAGARLAEVTAATLLIVGERDAMTLRFNHRARAAIAAECRLEVIAGATHLFEEAVALEQLADFACDWLTRHLDTRAVTRGCASDLPHLEGTKAHRVTAFRP
ncbi:hypothetical protein L2K20_29955 [Mycobacterium sp. MBM]|nr:hypothetical protein [Mycobacterium sp. MBM]